MSWTQGYGNRTWRSTAEIQKYADMSKSSVGPTDTNTSVPAKESFVFGQTTIKVLRESKS